MSLAKVRTDGASAARRSAAVQRLIRAAGVICRGEQLGPGVFRFPPGSVAALREAREGVLGTHQEVRR